jgi:hypothetical protein
MNGAARGLWSYLRRILSSRSDPVVTTFRARLPSQLEEARFQVTITMMWLSGIVPDQRQQAIAERRVLDAARPVALRYSVLDPDETRAAVDLELWDRGLADTDSQPVVTSVDVHVDSDDRRLAEEREALRRQTALARKACLADVERSRMLADEVLATPMLAQLWWLEGKPGKLQDLVAMGEKGMFEKVAELFGKSAEIQPADPIAELIRLFLQGLDARLREQLISQLRFVFADHERPDLVARLDDYQHPRAGPGEGVSPAATDGYDPRWRTCMSDPDGGPC